MIKADERLIVALDVDEVDEAEAVVKRLGAHVSFYKIGYRLGFNGGLKLAEGLIAAGKQVFLDFKLHDIGQTVEQGIRQIARLGVTFTTVHAYPQTMRAAMDGKGASALQVLGVTLLTSYDDLDVEEAGYALSVTDMVARRAKQASLIGLDGLVCSGEEAVLVRELITPDKLIVTPGIRLSSDALGDQKRVMTPQAALKAGATHLVVGRPILAAPDPVAAAQAILENMQGL
jgi:orotidine-5'-phosphate decarboxylase